MTAVMEQKVVLPDHTAMYGYNERRMDDSIVNFAR